MGTVGTKRQGFSDFGPGNVPAFMPHVILTDRADGKLWHLTYNLTVDPPSDGFGRIAITDVLPTDGFQQVYPADRGPVVQEEPEVRLIVRGGRLGFEFLALPGAQTDASNRRILARKSLQRAIREIIIPVSWNKVRLTALGWSPLNLLDVP